MFCRTDERDEFVDMSNLPLNFDSDGLSLSRWYNYTSEGRKSLYGQISWQIFDFVPIGRSVITVCVALCGVCMCVWCVCMCVWCVCMCVWCVYVRVVCVCAYMCVCVHM